ncbi:MAG: hypothetical protein OEV35_03280 [Gallionellaceae bacterium]|nr:hypothetical protein [Gallionellaceae bacterium]
MTWNSPCLYALYLSLGTLAACSTAPDRSINIGGISLAANTKQPAGNSDIFINVTKLVRDVAYRLKVGSHSLCSTYVTHDAGLSYLDSAMLERIGLQDSAKQFGAGSQLSVFHVVPDSAADAAGVKDGDVIEGVSEQKTAGNTPEKNLLKASLDQAVKSGNPFTLTLRRGSSRIQAEIKPEAACDFNVAVQAYSDPCCSIFVWRESDQHKEPVWHSLEGGPEFDPMLAESALALYISHNAAHVLMGHPEQLAKAQHPGRTTGIPSAVAVFGSAAADVGSLMPPFNQRTESEMRNEFEPKADLLSLYMLAASGYGTEVAVSKLRKLASPKGALSFPQLHVSIEADEFWRNVNKPPQTRDKLVTKPLDKTSRLIQMRYSRIEMEASRIDEKLRNGKPLTVDVIELQKIIWEIANTRIPEPDPEEELKKLPGSYQFGEPYIH